MNELRNRYRGCLLGLAAGDALGTTLEFRKPGSFTPIHDIVGGGPFRLQPGEWTDDTSMALCLSESLLTRRGFDPQHQLETYCRWWRNGHFSVTGRCFDIGTTTRDALEQFEVTGDSYCGSTSERAAGNGCIMRLAPIPMFFRRNAKEAIRRAGDSSRTTHGAQACIDASRYFAGLIVGALEGRPKDELLAPKFPPYAGAWEDHPLSPAIAEIANGSFRDREPPMIAGTGYVVKSLEAALWAFHRSTSFREGALLAVNLGDDADTTGAVYGQIAGAYYGCDGIPATWREVIAMRETIEKLADQLLEASESN